MPLLLSRMTALTGLLVHEETPDLAKGALRAMQDLYDAVTHDILSSNLRENYDTWGILIKARIEGRSYIGNQGSFSPRTGSFKDRLIINVSCIQTVGLIR